MLYHTVLLFDKKHNGISFTLHNIPIGYKIFSISELHLYNSHIFKA